MSKRVLRDEVHFKLLCMLHSKPGTCRVSKSGGASLHLSNDSVIREMLEVACKLPCCVGNHEVVNAGSSQ